MRFGLLLGLSALATVACARRPSEDAAPSKASLGDAPALSVARSHVALAKLGETRPVRSLATLSEALTQPSVLNRAGADGPKLEVLALDVVARPAIVEAGASIFEGVADQTDLLLTRDAASFEELRVLRGDRAPRTFRWAIETSTAGATLAVVRGGLEIRGPKREFLFSAPRPWALDAREQRYDLDWKVASARGDHGWVVEARLEASDARYPIVVDPVWVAAPRMDDGRMEASFAFVTGGMLVAGGPDALMSGATDSASLMDPATLTWKGVTSRLMNFRNYAGVAAVPLGSGTSIGGLVLGGTDAVAQAELFDPSIGGFRTIVGTQPVQPRYQFAMHRLPNGLILAAGGSDHNNVPLSTTDLYDPATESFTPGPAMQHPRILPASTLLDCGDVLVVGGYVYDSASNYVAVSTAERYVLAENKWVSAGAVHTPRYGSQLVALPNGSVMFAGGGDYVYQYSDVDIWSGATNTWTPTFPMDHGRWYVTPFLGSDGKVVVAGGVDEIGHTTASTSVYDPAAPGWVAGPPLAAPRADYAAATLSDGTVVLFGGHDFDGGIVDTVEVFDAGGTVAAPVGRCPGSDGGTGTAGDSMANEAGADGGASDAVGGDASGDAAASATTSTNDAATNPTSVAAGDAGVKASAFSGCQKDGDCATGHCVTGVCCDTACDTRCYSCRLPGAIGTCSPEPAGIDLNGSCGAAGNCDSTCDGHGGCRADRGGEQCAPAACANATQLRGPSVCGTVGGACPSTPLTYDCSPYVCESSLAACLVSCRSSGDCASGFDCDVASGQCKPTSGNASGGCALAGPSNGRWLGVALVAMLGAGLARRRRRNHPA
jgi:hypothetical protein